MTKSDAALWLTIFVLSLTAIIIAYKLAPILLKVNAAMTGTLAGILAIGISTELVNVISYALLVGEYGLAYLFFTALMSYISNEMSGDLNQLFLKGGDPDIYNEVSKKIKREVPLSAKALWFLFKWRYRAVGIVVIDRKNVKLRTMFRQWSIKLMEGGSVIGGGELTDNMLRASNWVDFLKKKVLSCKHLIIAAGIGGSHGETVLLSSFTNELISHLGCKMVTFIVFSNESILKMKVKAKNLRKLHKCLIEDVESPMFNPNSIKIFLDWETEEEGKLIDEDVAELIRSLYIHYTIPSGSQRGEDYINIVLNLSSKVSTLIRLPRLNRNPEILSREISEKFGILGEKIRLHPKAQQKDIHVPPSLISPNFAKEVGIIFLNPSDPSASERRSDLYRALDKLAQDNDLRMSVIVEPLEVPSMLLLIPIDAKSMINGLWWLHGLPENVVRKLTGEVIA